METRSAALHAGCLPPGDSGLRHFRQLLKGVVLLLSFFLLASLEIKADNHPEIINKARDKRHRRDLPVKEHFFIASLRLYVNLSLVQTTP